MSVKKTVHGVGYLGEGNFKCWDSSASKPTEEYSRWASMIRRCYDPKTHELQPAYVGSSVIDEWQNFQTFADWYTKQRNYGEGFELDKDVLGNGSKAYSPETCTLLPKEINASLIVKPTPEGKELPTGVTRTKNKVVNRYRVRVRGLLPSELYCYTSTVEDAIIKSREAKALRLSQLVDKYKDYLDTETKIAIMKFGINYK